MSAPIHFFASGAFLVFLFLSSFGIANAQSPCNLIPSGASVATGFGTPYNLFSQSQELLLSISCTDTNATLTAGNGSPSTYVYHKGYAWQDGQWQPFTLTGTNKVANAWYPEQASATFSRTTAEMQQINFLVAYTCQYRNQTWYCGCSDQTCVEGKWQLQAFQKGDSDGGKSPGFGVISHNIVDVGTTNAVIEWNLSDPGTGYIEYGTTQSYGNTTTKENRLLDYHRQSISDLAADTAYRYRIVSENGDGVTATVEGSFQTEDTSGPVATRLLLSSSMVTDATNMDSGTAPLFDGCPETGDCSVGTDTTEHLFVELDLGSMHDLTRARLFGDTGGSWHSYTWTLKHKKEAGGAWMTAFADQDAFGNQWFHEQLSSSARYVRLEVNGSPGSGSVQVLEFELYGVGPLQEEINGENQGDGEEALRTINVSSSSQLNDAISNAQPGDHIVLANGSYDGFTVSRDGTSNDPIVIRAANILDARVTGDVSIEGDYVWVIGLDYRNGSGVKIHGTGDRVSRSQFRTQGTSIDVRGSARQAVVDHNDIDSQSTGVETAWYGIALRVDPGDEGHSHYVYRNYLYDAPELTTGDDNTAIGCSTNGNRMNQHTANVIEYNLIENWRGDAEVIMTKASGCRIRHNTIVDSLEIDTRVGHDNQWVANWCENSRGIRIHDGGDDYGGSNDVIGNRCDIRIMGGNTTPPGMDEREGSHSAAWDTVAAGNVGMLRVGYTFSGHTEPARGTIVEAHDGEVQLLTEENTSVSNTTSRTIPQALKLSPGEVGPSAPTAPTF